jgi:hypothetical protein
MSAVTILFSLAESLSVFNELIDSLYHQTKLNNDNMGMPSSLKENYLQRLPHKTPNRI